MDRDDSDEVSTDGLIATNVDRIHNHRTRCYIADMLHTSLPFEF